MSTKNISRTVIEGGRISGYKYERKHSLRTERRGAKSTIQAVRDHDEFVDMELHTRKHSSYYPAEKFRDKLNPVERWLDSKVGKFWNKVFSKMKEEFDDRTTPGRHILYDHMLSQVWTSQDRTTARAEYYTYYVDAQGILRKNANWRERYSDKEYKAAVKERETIGQWLAGRYIGKIGNVLYWFEPTRPIPNPIKFSWNWEGPKYIYHRYSLTNPNNWYEWHAPFRQGTKMAGKDVEFFSKLHDRNKTWLLEHSPQHKKTYDYSFGRF